MPYFPLALLILLVINVFDYFYVLAGRTVLELQPLNFELSITSYQYLAVLFTDSSEISVSLSDTWAAAASLAEVCADCAVARIDGTDPELRELIDAYSLTLPCARVFRRGVMADYRYIAAHCVEQFSCFSLHSAGVH
jgi:hypothetical protein